MVDDFRQKINEIVERAENYSWLYYLAVLVLLGLIRLELITAQENVMDIILTITAIILFSHLINKFKNRKHPKKPYLQCLNCGVDIEPTGEWRCKKCDWSTKFPNN